MYVYTTLTILAVFKCMVLGHQEQHTVGVSEFWFVWEMSVFEDFDPNWW